MNRKIATALATLAAAVSFVSISATPASAWSYQSASGSVGGVVLPRVYVGDLYQSGLTKFTLYSSTGPTVYRSPASSGTQVVKARYHVQQWNGSTWISVKTSPLLTGQISSTQTGVAFVAAYVQPDTARGYFRFMWAFDWSTTSGSRLASTFVVPTLATDHTCVTRIRLCRATAGYVQTGGQNTGAW